MYYSAYWGMTRSLEPDEIDATVEERGYAKGALAVFLRIEGGLNTKMVDNVNDTAGGGSHTRRATAGGGGGSGGVGIFSAQEFCRRLVMDIKYPQDGGGGGAASSSSGGGGDKGELVGGANKCQIIIGYPYFVRGWAALRTLVRRRRKNNQCLRQDGNCQGCGLQQVLISVKLQLVRVREDQCDNIIARGVGKRNASDDIDVDIGKYEKKLLKNIGSNSHSNRSLLGNCSSLLGNHHHHCRRHHQFPYPTQQQQCRC